MSHDFISKFISNIKFYIKFIFACAFFLIVRQIDNHWSKSLDRNDYMLLLYRKHFTSLLAFDIASSLSLSVEFNFFLSDETVSAKKTDHLKGD